MLRRLQAARQGPEGGNVGCREDPARDARPDRSQPRQKLAVPGLFLRPDWTWAWWCTRRHAVEALRKSSGRIKNADLGSRASDRRPKIVPVGTSRRVRPLDLVGLAELAVPADFHGFVDPQFGGCRQRGGGRKVVEGEPDKSALGPQEDQADRRDGLPWRRLDLKRPRTAEGFGRREEDRVRAGYGCTPTFPGPSASRKPGLKKQLSNRSETVDVIEDTAAASSPTPPTVPSAPRASDSAGPRAGATRSPV